jgi:transposase-like protein
LQTLVDYVSLALLVFMNVCLQELSASAERGPTRGSKGKSASMNLDSHAELQKLRKKNKRLRMEREILKKVAVFVAKEVE